MVRALTVAVGLLALTGCDPERPEPEVEPCAVVSGEAATAQGLVIITPDVQVQTDVGVTLVCEVGECQEVGAADNCELVIDGSVVEDGRPAGHLRLTSGGREPSLCPQLDSAVAEGADGVDFHVSYPEPGLNLATDAPLVVPCDAETSDGGVDYIPLVASFPPDAEDGATGTLTLEGGAYQVAEPLVLTFVYRPAS